VDQQWSLARYRNTSILGFTPDGASLYRISNEDGQQDLWVDGTRLTDLRDRVARRFVVEPSGSVILAADRHGDENFQLYRVTRDGGISDLIVREGVQHHLRARSLSRDGRRLAYSANHRDRGNVEVVVRELSSGEERVVLGGEAWHVVGDWSPDARLLLASRVQDNTDQDLFLVDVRSGEATHLTPHEGDRKHFPVGFDASGDAIYFLTDCDAEFLWLARMDLRSKHAEPVVRESWDVLFARLDRDARTLVWVVNEDGASRLVGRDERTTQPLAIAPLPRGCINDAAVSADGARIAVQWSSTAAPWRTRVHERGGWRDVDATRIAYGGELAPDAPIRVPGPRGDIPALLIRPRASERVPLVVHVHGGPEDQERVRYVALHQYLAARDIAVLVPNIHGSTGYGSSWQRAIHLDWGGVDLADIEALAKWACAQPWVDADRIAIFGGSYGGFATLSAITRLPRYWRVAVDAFGPSDLVSFVSGAAPSWRRFMRRWVGDAEADAEKLRERSPLTYAENVRCPLLVLAGASDPRVRKAESDQFVKRMRELGKDVAYVEESATGHGWTTQAAYRAAYARIADFLVTHLL
jgi:dipeptidyl aminopeptidase/acylaminoacyl peptidase